MLVKRFVQNIMALQYSARRIVGMPGGSSKVEVESGDAPWPISPTKLLFIIYCAAHLPLLGLGLVGARYWDDWSLFHGSPEVILETFREAGNPLFGLLHVGLLQLGWSAFAITTFIAFLLVTVLTYAIVVALGHDRSRAFLIAALVAVIPANFARVAAVDVPYAVSLALFMMAWWFLATRPNAILARIMFLALSGLSFQTGSLLVLYAAPVACYLLRSPKTGLIRRMVGSLDLLLLPILYWFARNTWLHPRGMFAGYNSPSVDFHTFVETFVSMGYFMRGDGLVISASGLLATGFLAWALTPLLNDRLPSIPVVSRRSSLMLVVAGLFLAFLGLFPYLAVGKIPSYVLWTGTRHQVAAMLGFAVLLAGLFSFLVRVRRRIFVDSRGLLFFVLLLGVANWWCVYAQFYMDYAQQEAVAILMKKHPEMRKGNFVIINITRMNAFHTMPGISEYAGLHSIAGYPHDSLIYDYSALGEYRKWRDFTRLYARYWGKWTKTEGVDVNAPPRVYVLSSATSIRNPFEFSMELLFDELLPRAKKEERLGRLLRLDGPFVPQRKIAMTAAKAKMTQVGGGR